MMDDAVREIHGMSCCDNDVCESPVRLTIRETDELIVLKSTASHGSVMTEWQARYLAAKLYRLSRRIRQRRQE